MPKRYSKRIIKKNSSVKPFRRSATKNETKNTAKKIAKNTVKNTAGNSGVKTTYSGNRRSSLFEKESGEGHRLQKILAVAGLGSRRQCEELIEQGRVEVDGSVARLGCKIDPVQSEIKVDGERLKKAKPVYLALFKPKGYLCTNRDQQGRARTLDLIPQTFGRLFLIGRLDMDSEGLILLTNDGALSERLTHPKYGVPKVYRVQAAGELTQDSVNQLRKGMYFAEGFAKVSGAVIKGQYKQSTILDITLSEGKNREVRRLFAKLGHKVLTLIRIAVGPVKLGKLTPGEWRHLTRQEVDQLYTAGQ
jgi:23S rRNA pseudouridine2605 synthase